MSYKDFLLKTVNAVSVLTISGALLATTCLSVAQAMDVEEDRGSSLSKINFPKAIDFNKASHAVKKIKSIFGAMQARQRDFIDVMEAFANKLADPKSYSNEKLDIVSPYWSQFIKSEMSQATSKRGRLQAQFNEKSRALEFALDDFRVKLTQAKNALQGSQVLFDMCDEYLGSQNQNSQEIILKSLFNSLLGTHLFNLTNLVDNYLLISNENPEYYRSLNFDDINAYYTQDFRLRALYDLYYLDEYIPSIKMLFNLGIQPVEKYWSFAENTKKSIGGSLTLDEPSEFLLDGFLFKKGLEKAGRSFEKFQSLVQSSLTTTHVGGGFDGNTIKVETLSELEKQNARKEYNQLFQAHRKRVESYIKKLTKKDFINIKKSKDFLEAALQKESPLDLTTSSITTITPKPNLKKHKKKSNGENKSLTQMDSGKSLPLQEDKVPIESIQTVKPLEIKDESPSLPRKVSPQDNKTIDTPISSPVSSTPIQQGEIKKISPRVRINSNINSNSETILNIMPTSELDLEIKPRKKRNRRNKFLTQEQEKHSELPQIMDDVKPLPVQEDRVPLESIQTEKSLEIKDESPSLSRKVSPQEHKINSITSPINFNYTKEFKIKEENVRININNKSTNILNKILDSISRPFTINYVQALNAMSKIGISELPPKRKGDFRKLVRKDSVDVILGTVFAYCPTTPTLGHELMKIYRAFIQQQLKDRTDIDLR
jgi:hypothetical protein